MFRGEIWWVDFDPSLGSEIRKTRPAIIVSNDMGNLHSKRVHVVPVTSNTERVYPVEALIIIHGKHSKAMADQATCVDKSRLKEKIGMVAPIEMLHIDKALRIQFNLP